MRAVVICNGAVEAGERPDPVPGTGEVLVAVQAAGLNGADLAQLAGRYPPPTGWAPDIPGLELAGEVVAVGPGAKRFEVGTRVMGLVGGGGQAELVAVWERLLMPVPEALEWPHAGGFPEVFTTAHDALFTQADLRPGERLLVHGAAGGVGTAGIQLGLSAGACVTATVRRPSVRTAVAELGADVVPAEGFADHGPFDVVLELIGAGNLREDSTSLNRGGRISIIGVSAGSAGSIDLRVLMDKHARLHGSTLRDRSPEAKAEALRLVERQVLPLVEKGALRVPVAKTYALANVTDAYEHFAAGGKVGKIVLLL